MIDNCPAALTFIGGTPPLARRLLNHVMLKRLARLFTIKTRFEAFPGHLRHRRRRGRTRPPLSSKPIPAIWGVMLAVLCTGVVFLAGAKLLDSVRPAEAVPAPGAGGSPAPPGQS